MRPATVALMVASLCGTAAKQGGKDRATYNFKGSVQEVAADGAYVVVDVAGGNKRARSPRSLAGRRYARDED